MTFPPPAPPPAPASSVSPAEALAPLVRNTFRSSTLRFHLNSTPVALHNPDPTLTLLDFIRSQPSLKGTKLGCGEGGCGACTVVIQQPSTAAQRSRNRNKIHHLAVNACLAPLISVDGKHVLTIEALGNAENPHPLQERIARLHGSQCGFCTPGIVMSLYALLRNAYEPERGVFRLSEQEVELNGELDGNLCRCTGYWPILEAAKSFVREELGGEIVGGDKPGGAGNRMAGSQRSADENKSCGRPGGCCRDKSPSSSEDSSRGGGGSSSEISGTTTPDTDPSSPPISGAEYGAPTEMAGAASHPPPNNGCGKPDCCQLRNGTKATTAVDGLDSKKSGRYEFPQFNFKPYQPCTELIYPAALRKHVYEPLYFGSEKKVWFRPTNLEQLLEIKNAFPSAKLVGGASEVQVEIRFKNSEVAVAVYVGDVEEIKGFSVDEDKVVVGGGTSLTDIEKGCKEWSEKLGNKGMVLEAVRKQLRYFAGRQIRNTATAAGNIATASPISDLNPVLVASDSKIIVHSLSRGEEIFNVTDFFVGYRTTMLPPDAIITKIVIPLGKEREIVKAYKQAKRKDDDIAIVTAGFRAVIDKEGYVEDISLAYGGMAPTTVQAKETQGLLVGKKWFDPSVLEEVMGALEKDFHLSYTVPGGMATYRKTLAFTFFLRFWHAVAAELELGPADGDLISELHRELSTSTRDNENPYEQRVVGKQIPHLSGLKQATGEAEYIDDIPKTEGELYGALVLSTKAHAKLIEVDPSPALELPGVKGYVDERDLPEERSWWGSVKKDERFFAKDEVLSYGQPIGCIYATTQAQAQAAAKAVRIIYEDLPVMISISDAIAANSFWPYDHKLKKGEPIDAAFAKCDHVFEGVSQIGGQEHFYLETNASLVIPKREDGCMEVWSSTQNTMETQEFVSQVTGVPSNRIVARVKRMGGAFGGKESRSVQVAAILAVAAKKAGVPIRMMLNRDEDMMVSGQRHPFQARWKVGVSKEGKLMALEADVYNNAGFSTDMSGAVMDRALTHIDSCYDYGNVELRGHVCKTHTHSNTAFRGFGAPQGMYITECIITTVADKLGLDVDEVRVKNFYKEGSITPFLQTLYDWHIPQLHTSLTSSSDYRSRKQTITHYNMTHSHKKRGIALLPTKFGISFATALHLNQAGALIHIYHDGSILLAHGGTEMGQGLYTKMIQVAAQELQVPLDQVFTADSSSNTVANPSPTAASSGSDLNGMAIKHACDQLNARLQPYREKLKTTNMKILADAAYKDRVNLSANGFYKTPDIGYVWGNHVDPLPVYAYFTQGVACAEVELDTLTGDHTVRRVDIEMDIGRSINPAIDYGQVEGAFVQGQGLFTVEETLWGGKTGELMTRGPGTYKIPGFGDVAQEVNVRFLKEPESGWRRLKSIQSSKGVGEPPTFLGASVLFALREAVKAAREGTKEMQEVVQLESPATCERLLRAIGGRVWQKMEVPSGGKRGFFVTAQE